MLTCLTPPWRDQPAQLNYNTDTLITMLAPWVTVWVASQYTDKHTHSHMVIYWVCPLRYHGDRPPETALNHTLVQVVSNTPTSIVCHFCEDSFED